MKKIVCQVVMILAVFGAGCLAGYVTKGPERAEAGYSCTYYTNSSCYNASAATQELYVDVNFSKAMKYTRMGYSNDRKNWSIYFIPQ